MFTSHFLRSRLLRTLTVPALMSTNATTPSSSSSPLYPTLTYAPRHPSFPYTANDFQRLDESTDTDFYSTPRFVTHIDDNAISLLRQYYASALPRSGRILDFCSSWISHFPTNLEARAVKTARGESQTEATGESKGALEVIGAGMNKAELDANPILTQRVLQDLNAIPDIPESIGPLDAATCVVSIDYLTHPLETLASIRRRLKVGGQVHLVISNRCFPTKVVGRWLRISEDERVQMAGDYLWWAGFRDVEILTVCDGRVKEGEDGRGGGAWALLSLGSGRVDPLWVVRGRKV